MLNVNFNLKNLKILKESLKYLLLLTLILLLKIYPKNSLRNVKKNCWQTCYWGNIKDSKKKKKKGSNLNAQHQRIEHHTTEYYIDITEYTIQNFNNDIRNAYNLIIVGHEYQQL